MLILPEFGTLVTKGTLLGMQEFDDEITRVLLPELIKEPALILWPWLQRCVQSEC